MLYVHPRQQSADRMEYTIHLESLQHGLRGLIAQMEASLRIVAESQELIKRTDAMLRGVIDQ
jgi:hypothetical protein